MSRELDDDHAEAICRVLVDRGVEFVIGATDVNVASLDDVIRSKRTAGRPKDIVALRDLEARARALGEHRDADS